MNERESEPDPYVPPQSEVAVSPAVEGKWKRKQSRVEKVLRWVGAGCVIYLMMVSLLRGASTDWMVKVAVVAVWSLPVVVFLWGGRKLHVVLCVLLLVGALANAYFMKLTWDAAPRMNGDVAVRRMVNAVMSASALWVGLGCAVVLCVRGWRRA